MFKVMRAAPVQRLEAAILRFAPRERTQATELANAVAHELADLDERATPLVAAGKVAWESTLRAKREIEVLARVRHPQLIRILDFEKTEQPRWYVMPLMKGGTLKDAFEAGRYKGDLPGVVRGMLHLAEALGVLHSDATPVVHRDVKPGNVFIADDSSWVLGDLGVAYQEDDGDATKTRAVSKDWFPRWPDDPLGHLPSVDCYMLAALGVSLIVGQKLLDRAWLDEDDGHPDFNLAKMMPGTAGVVEFMALVRGLLAKRGTTVSCKNGLELAGRLRELLPLVEQDEAYKLRAELARLTAEPRLLYSYAGLGPRATGGDVPALSNMWVWIPTAATRLDVWVQYDRADARFTLVGHGEGAVPMFNSEPLSHAVINRVPIPRAAAGSWCRLSVRPVEQVWTTAQVISLVVHALGATPRAGTHL